MLLVQLVVALLDVFLPITLLYASDNRLVCVHTCTIHNAPARPLVTPLAFAIFNAIFNARPLVTPPAPAAFAIFNQPV